MKLNYKTTIPVPPLGVTMRFHLIGWIYFRGTGTSFLLVNLRKSSFCDEEMKMAAFTGEHWRSELPGHEIFIKLREKLHLEPQASGRRLAKNLTFCLNGDLFVWDHDDSVFYTTNLRQLNPEERDSSAYQVSLLSSSGYLHKLTS